MSSVNYKPPYKITDKIVNLVSDISEILTIIKVNEGLISNPRLRRDNRVKTIHASLAIENNTLSLEQMTDIINGKRVLGSPDEICEVKNAFEAYEKLLNLNPYSVEDMLCAHKVLMTDLTKEAGVFRHGGVGIFAGENLVHMAPPAMYVPKLIDDLIRWVKNDNRVHPLIKSSVFHYEFEFIHPFADGNGRMGRMWQTLLLYKWNSLFGWLPIETLVKERQEQYYKVLGECDKAASSERFIEFTLQAIYDALIEVKTDQVTVQVTDQVKRLVDAIGTDILSAKELMERLSLKHMPTFRKNYMKPALELGFIEMTIPDKPTSSRQKYKKV